MERERETEKKGRERNGEEKRAGERETALLSQSQREKMKRAPK